MTTKRALEIRQRLLHRVAAHRVGQPECLDGDVVRRVLGVRPNGNIALDDPLQSGAARRNQRWIIVFGIVASPSSRWEAPLLNSADCVGIAPGAGIALGQRAVRLCRIEAVRAAAARFGD